MMFGDEWLELHAAAASKAAHGGAANQWARFMDTFLPCDMSAVAGDARIGSPWKKIKNVGRYAANGVGASR